MVCAKTDVQTFIYTHRHHKVLRSRHLGEISPCDVWEVVMLVVIANVVCQHVQRAVVRVCLRLAIDYIVLCNEVPSRGVNAASHEGGEQEVQDGLRSEEVHHAKVEGELPRCISCRQLHVGVFLMGKQKRHGKDFSRLGTSAS